jgi:tRNA(adenine34) deaminase
VTTTHLKEAFSGLDPAWREAFVLAWESYVAGSNPVGAVVVDQDRRVVGRGRNQVLDVRIGTGRLASTDIAHAEINALADIGRGSAGLTLLSTLEPCPMCAGAAMLSRVGTVAYAATDPFFGVSRFPTLRDRFEQRGRRLEEPVPEPLASFAGALVLEFELRDAAVAEVAEAWQAEHGATRLARRLRTKGRLDELARAHAEIDEVVDVAARLLS